MSSSNVIECSGGNIHKTGLDFIQGVLEYCGNVSSQLNAAERGPEEEDELGDDELDQENMKFLKNQRFSTKNEGKCV